MRIFNLFTVNNVRRSKTYSLFLPRHLTPHSSACFGGIAGQIADTSCGLTLRKTERQVLFCYFKIFLMALSVPLKRCSGVKLQTVGNSGSSLSVSGKADLTGTLDFHAWKMSM